MGSEKGWSILACLIWLVLLLATALHAGAFEEGSGQGVRLVSHAQNGDAADARSTTPDIDDRARFVTFVSPATNIAPGPDANVCEERNHCWALFVHDVVNGTIERALMSGHGLVPNRDVFDPVMSGDGSTIAFLSHASNLVPDDDNGVLDYFVLNLTNASVQLVSRDWNGQVQEAPAGPSCSPGCGNPMISATGRYVAFSTVSNGLVPNDQNDVLDVYRRDLRTGQIVRVSQGAGGQEPNGKSIIRGVSSMSDDGRFIVYASQASNIVEVDLPDCPGSWLGPAGEACWQVYLFDAERNRTILVSTSSDGGPGNDQSGRPAISGDAAWIYFQSKASNLDPRDSHGDYDVYGYHRPTGNLILVSDVLGVRRGEGIAFEPTTNRDGSVVAFLTDREAYGAEDQLHGVVVTRPSSGEWAVVSRSVDGEWANGPMGRISMSGDGRVLAIFGGATDLVDRPVFMEGDRSNVYVATNPLFPDARLPGLSIGGDVARASPTAGAILGVSVIVFATAFFWRRR